MNILITGSSGLVGTEAVNYFRERGHLVTGLDNNMRHGLFGTPKQPRADVDWDIRIAPDVSGYDAIIHCAAQPSHELSAHFPILDFETNAFATLKLLEATRLQAPDAVFVYLSTNKVYGDLLDLKTTELPTRYQSGTVDETFPVDCSTHSPFGCSKLSADIYVQEYARYFGMKAVVLRPGCITGRYQQGTELHGFLSYLVKCAKEGKKYVVHGYKGKQVRDNIHSFDLVSAIDLIIHDPVPDVFNIGGEQQNSISIIEAMNIIEHRMGKSMDWDYNPTPRKGDHICYVTNMNKFRLCYPQWQRTKSLLDILDELL